MLLFVAASIINPWSSTSALPIRTPPIEVAGRTDERSVPSAAARLKDADGHQDDWPWRTIPLLSVVVLLMGLSNIRVHPVLIFVWRR